MPTSFSATSNYSLDSVLDSAAKNASSDMAASALDLPVTALAGVGPKVAEQLTQLGIARIFDLLLHLPRDYEDRS